MAKELSTKIPKLTFKNVIGYGCGDAGGVITLYIVTLNMTRYLQVHLAVDPVILAGMLFIWSAWDTINDPLMGTLMDLVFQKAKPGRDKFRPWILASIPVMLFGGIAFYNVPGRLGGGWPMVISLFILKIIYEGGYTMMNIGMGSLLGAMSTNDQERATLSSARGMGSTVGGLIAGIVIPQLISRFGDNATGYGIMAAIMFPLAMVIVFLHYALTQERNKAATSEYEDLMEFIRGAVDEADTVDSINALVEKLPTLQHVFNSKLLASKMLNDKAAKMGLKFNKLNNRYEAA